MTCFFCFFSGVKAGIVAVAVAVSWNPKWRLGVQTQDKSELFLACSFDDEANHCHGNGWKSPFPFQLSHGKKTYFPLNPGCLMEILTMVYYHPHIIVSIIPCIPWTTRVFSIAQLKNAYLVQMWEIDPPKPSIFIHIYPHRFPALEFYRFEVLGFFPFEKFGCWFEVGAGRSRRWWDGCSSEKLQLSWLKSSCSSLVWMGPLEVVKENGETPIFSHDDKFSTKIMVLFLETKLYKNGGQGLPGFTISDRPTMAGCHIMSWQGHYITNPNNALLWRESQKLPYISLVWSSPTWCVKKKLVFKPIFSGMTFQLGRIPKKSDFHTTKVKVK